MPGRKSVRLIPSLPSLLIGPRWRSLRMATRGLFSSLAVAFAFCVFPASAATYRTPNFTVEAATPELARQFGEQAEHFRKVKAREWLGEEMPNWQHPCPLR